jgi:hypothetical protein
VTTAQQYLAVQRGQLGQGETPDGSNHTIYGAFTGYQNQPWCGSFQLWAAHQAGLVLPPNVSPALVYTPAGAAAYQKDGRWSATPMVGAHVFYRWPGSSRIDHVECVESILPDGSFYALGGNVSNRVMRTHRSHDSVVGFGLPVYTIAPLPPGPPPAPHPVGTTRVSLSAVIAAAKHDAPAAGQPTEHKVDVLPVERALAAEHLLASQYVDGSFGKMTIAAYAGWQRHCGYQGVDANGVPGSASLIKLGARHGFVVVR